jgi:hypothetical protein
MYITFKNADDPNNLSSLSLGFTSQVESKSFIDYLGGVSAAFTIDEKQACVYLSAQYSYNPLGCFISLPSPDMVDKFKDFIGDEACNTLDVSTVEGVPDALYFGKNSLIFKDGDKTVAGYPKPTAPPRPQDDSTAFLQTTPSAPPLNTANLSEISIYREYRGTNKSTMYLMLTPNLPETRDFLTEAFKSISMQGLQISSVEATSKRISLALPLSDSGQLTFNDLKSKNNFISMIKKFSIPLPHETCANDENSLRINHPGLTKQEEQTQVANNAYSLYQSNSTTETSDINEFTQGLTT